MTEAPLGLPTGNAPITADNLEPRIGQEFVFARPANEDGSSAGVARMKLVKLTRLQRHNLTDREPFSIIFIMLDQPPLSLGLHRLMDRELEPFDMFLSRVLVPQLQRDNPAGMFYEAIFN